MKLHFAYRAAKVLYDFLVTNQITGTFLLPVNICTSVPDTFREAGCEVKYLDIQPDTLCIDESKTLEQISNCAGVLLAHTYGTERDFNTFFKAIRNVNHNAIIIDDRCLCMPDFEIDGRYDNAEADLTLFSFGDKKQVQLGEGGLGIIKDKWNCENVIVKDENSFENKSFTFDNAKYLLQKNAAKVHVQEIQSIYRQNLPKDIQMPMEFNNWRFNILVSDGQKDAILKSLFSNGLFASSHYKPLENKSHINAEKLYGEIINLFIDLKYYTIHQATKTYTIINDVIKLKR